MYFQTMLSNENMQICVNAIITDSSVAAIIYPGLNLSKSGPFFLLSNIARSCAGIGISTFQFDYFGDGDSSGSYKNINLHQVKTSMSLVKNFAKKHGYNKFIYIGYGIGNILMSSIANESDVIGLCMIAPHLEAHKKIDMVIEKTLEYSSDYILDKDYIWPNTKEILLREYWISIIGIVDWLYYTPFNIKFLQEIGEIYLDSILLDATKNILFLAPQGVFLDYRQQNHKVVDLPSLHYRTKEEWESFKEWPDIWDEIASKIPEWINSLVCNEISFNQIASREANNSYFKDCYIERNTKNNVSFPVSFPSGNKTLFGMLHIPRKDKPQEEKFPCVIYEPGLGGSRVDMSRAGPWLGDALSSNRCVCLRYDSTGSGVSEGDFKDVTWEQRYQDIKSAIKYLESIDFADISKIIIVSYSAGAKVACLAAQRIPNVKGCVFWSPHLIDDARSPNKPQLLLREKQLVSPMCGLWLSYDYIKSDSQYTFLDLFKSIDIPILAITGSDADKDNNILPILNECYSNFKKVIQYPGAHCFLYQYMSSVISDTIKFISMFSEV